MIAGKGCSFQTYLVPNLVKTELISICMISIKLLRNSQCSKSRKVKKLSVQAYV